MGGVPKQFWAWLSKLLPRQKVVGDCALQIGNMQGHAKVCIDQGEHKHSHQHAHTHAHHQHGAVLLGTTTASGPVVVNNHYHLHAGLSPVAPPAQRTSGQDAQFPPDAGNSSAPSAVQRTNKTVATPRQRQVLALIKRTGNEKAVLRWMEKTFGTRWVVALEDGQLNRVELYCETVISNAQTKRRVEMGR